MTDQEKIAQFIASRGVKKIPAGQATLGHLTRADWRNVVRGEPTEQDLINQRRVIRTGIDGKEYVQNGLGEWIS